MKIVIIADTHMPKMAKKLPARLVDELKNTDLILHAGDWQTMNLYEELTQYAPVEEWQGISIARICKITSEKRRL